MENNILQEKTLDFHFQHDVIFLNRKYTDRWKMITQQEIVAKLFRDGLKLPPVVLQFASWAPAEGGDRPSGIATATWRGKTLEFVVEVKAQVSPKVLQVVMDQAQRLASRWGKPPMIVVPYLSDENLQKLEEADLSGLDLSGNGVLCIPGKLLILRTGQPNLFRQSDIVKNAYAGDTSMVARALLLRPAFGAVTDLVDFIQDRQGEITFSTVSKALKKLEEDVVIRRQSNAISLIQPDRLLGRLLLAYKPPREAERLQGRCGIPLATAMNGLVRAAKQTNAKIAMTGEASADRYAVLAREPILQVYINQPPSFLLAQAGLRMEATPRFPDIELIETTDKRVFFDVREKNGIPYSSPVQTWLELAGGDKRLREVAEQLREALLRGREVGA